MLTGENGILTQAQRAKNETENAAKQEEMDLAQLEATVMGKDVPIIQVDDENPGQLEQENDTTFVINSIEDLVFFSYDVTTNGNKYEDQTVKLGTNLDFSSDKSYVDPNRENYYGYSGKLKEALTSENGFQPIGELSKTGTKYFYGTFDGNNNEICSLYINIDRNENVRAGLFSSCYGKIENLGVVNTNILVKGLETSVGALVGSSYNNIYNSYATGNVNVTGSSWMPVGGLCGVMQGNGDIENCYNIANINCENIKEETGSANITCGGIVGQTENEEVIISKCFNKGNIFVNGGNNETIVGGICGAINSGEIIKNCYNSAIVKGTTKAQTLSAIRVGGIVGNLNSDLFNCYNFGNVVTIEKVYTLSIGGIVGNVRTNKVINNVYNMGEVIVEYSTGGSTIGGIIGENGILALNNAYNIGRIVIENGDSQTIGSISGRTNQITFNNCYYETGTYDVGVGESEAVTGVIEVDSIDESVLSVVNGEGAFKEDTKGINNGYPILEWQ